MHGHSGGQHTPPDAASAPTGMHSVREHLKRTSPDTPLPKKRIKKAQSCDPCRRRKLKCDRGYPCGACRDRKEQHLCAWEDGVVPKHIGRDASDSPAVLKRLEAMETRMDKLLDKVESFHQRLSAPRPLTNTSNSEALDVGGLFGLSWSPMSSARKRRALTHMHTHLPDKETMLDLLDMYIKEIYWMQQIFSYASVLQCIERTAGLSDLCDGSNYLDKLRDDEVDRLIYDEALLFCTFGIALVFTHDVKLDRIDLAYPAAPLYGRYFDQAVLGLSTLNVFEEPDMSFVICGMLLSVGMTTARAPIIASVLLTQAIQVAYMLDLDVEPPPCMPEFEARIRVQLFSTLTAFDWFLTSTTKRYPLIQKKPERIPSVFGTEEQRSKYQNNYHRSKLAIAELYCKSSPLVMPVDVSYEYTCQLHYEISKVEGYNEGLWDYTGEYEHEVPKRTRDLHRMMSSGALNFLVIRVHLPYYMRGWEDSTYRLSRDACFSSARNLLRIFRAAFSWKCKFEDIPGRAYSGQLPAQISFAGRTWWFCSWCTAGALLLLKHLTVMTEYNQSPNWDPERESIIQDLCIMSRLLHYLSPVNVIAREGYDAMQRVAGHLLGKNFGASDHSGNCVAHWAERIVQEKSKASTEGKDMPCFATEPLCLLSSMINNTNSVGKNGSYPAGTNCSFDVSNMRSSNDTSTEKGCAAERNAGSRSSSPSVSAYSALPKQTELDTFWARFALPNLPPTIATPNEVPIVGFSYGDTMLGTRTIPLPDPSSFAPPSMDNGMFDTSMLLPSKDRISSTQFDFTSNSYDSYTDDFIKTFESLTQDSIPM